MRDEYRWTDHVISPGRLRIEFIASLVILAIVGGAGLANGQPDRTHHSYVVESAVPVRHAPGLAAITKPQFPSRGKGTQC